MQFDLQGKQGMSFGEKVLTTLEVQLDPSEMKTNAGISRGRTGNCEVVFNDQESVDFIYSPTAGADAREFPRIIEARIGSSDISLKYEIGSGAFHTARIVAIPGPMGMRGRIQVETFGCDEEPLTRPDDLLSGLVSIGDPRNAVRLVGGLVKQHMGIITKKDEPKKNEDVQSPEAVAVSAA